MAAFLFKVIGKLNLFPSCNNFVTSAGISEFDKLINHLSFVVIKGSAEESKNFKGSILVWTNVSLIEAIGSFGCDLRTLLLAPLTKQENTIGLIFLALFNLDTRSSQRNFFL